MWILNDTGDCLINTDYVSQVYVEEVLGEQRVMASDATVYDGEAHWTLYRGEDREQALKVMLDLQETLNGLE